MCREGNFIGVLNIFNLEFVKITCAYPHTSGHFNRKGIPMLNLIKMYCNNVEAGHFVKTLIYLVSNWYSFIKSFFILHNTQINHVTSLKIRNKYVNIILDTLLVLSTVCWHHSIKLFSISSTRVFTYEYYVILTSNITIVIAVSGQSFVVVCNVLVIFTQFIMDK